MKEREIDLKKLLIDFGLRWRSIFLITVLGVVVFGVLGGVQAFGTGGPLIDANYLILGFFLSVVGYAFVYLFLTLSNPYITVDDEFEEIYSIPQLGLIVGDKKSEKFLSVIDNALLKVRYRNDRRPTEAKALNLAYTAVKLAIQKGGYDRLCLVGCDVSGHSAYVCEQLKGALEKKGIEVEVLNNVLYDFKSMNKLEFAQCVVLVERVGSTTYKEIQRELELMHRVSVDVLGGIIVE